MAKPIQLSLDGDWESIVNNVDRHNKRCRRDQAKRESELHKMLNKALCFAMVAALALILNIAELLTIWVAVAVALPCLCAACFIGGRFYEAIHK